MSSMSPFRDTELEAPLETLPEPREYDFEAYEGAAPAPAEAPEHEEWEAWDEWEGEPRQELQEDAYEAAESAEAVQEGEEPEVLEAALDGASQYLPASGLEWPDATPEQLAFMRAVYERHVALARQQGRVFVPEIPASELERIEGRHLARHAAARDARALLEEARSAIAAQGLEARVKVGILSAYRSPSRQFDIWQGKGRRGRGGFPYYYRKTQARRRRFGDEHGPEAVDYLAGYLSKWIAAPGFSNHNDGLAIDFWTSEGGRERALWPDCWFHRWLRDNAGRLGFEEYAPEPWHWNYRRAATAPQREAVQPEEWFGLGATATTGIRADTKTIARVPVLASHRGNPPALILGWNDMQAVPDEVDVVVHLHGYSKPWVDLRKNIVPISGLDLQPVDGAPGTGRTRPTLTILPRGDFTGKQQTGGPNYVYTFPALTTRDGLLNLVRFALEQFAALVGIPVPRRGRLILTAHSGGGAPLLTILRHHDPDEVFVYDALYQDPSPQHPSPLVEWMRKRIGQDAGGASAPGALRVFFFGRGRTAQNSLTVLRAIEAALDPSSALRARYRVEKTTIVHPRIPRAYGWRLLADAGADVPNVQRAAAQHELWEGEGDQECERLDELDEALEAPERDYQLEPGLKLGDAEDAETALEWDQFAELLDELSNGATPLPAAEAMAGEQWFEEPSRLVGVNEHFVPPADAGASEDVSRAAEDEAATTSYEELEDLMTADEEPAALVDPAGEAQIVATMERPLAVKGLDSEAAPFEHQVAAKPVATRVSVSVRTDFAVRHGGRLTFDWVPGEPVAHAQIEVVGTAIAATTNARGVAVIDTSTVPDGDHILRLSHTSPDASTTNRAGPAVADPLATRPPRIYRVLDVRLRIDKGRIVTAWIAPGKTHGGIGNRAQATFSRTHLPIDWKPVWMQSPMKPTEAMRPANDIDLIVVHHTSGPQIGPAINTFMNAHVIQNAHYVIDRDGHVVKIAEDLRRANQAGISRWHGRTSLSGSSIGIENVHRSGAFTAEQYASLLDLLVQLRAAYPTIPARRIVGHSDVATSSADPVVLSDRRADDPGAEFEWPTLEAAGLGMVPVPTAPPGVAYAGIFSGALGAARVALRRGDCDPAPQRAAVIGGVRRPGFAGTPVRELQEDLKHIGYSLKMSPAVLGTFDFSCEQAVDRFQRHFFAGARKGLRAGRMKRVDAVTADWIKRVRRAIP
jgi:N-acetyl-anhydromuramyl-L-alanine amidase AmpD